MTDDGDFKPTADPISRTVGGYPRLTGIPGLDPTVLEPLEPLLPAGRHIDLDIAAAAITSTLTAHRLTRTSDPAEHARLHATHAFRLASAGRREQALAPAEEAVAIRRRLAEANPDAYLPDLAMSLTAPLHCLFGERDEFLGRRWSDGYSEPGERCGESCGRRIV